MSIASRRVQVAALAILMAVAVAFCVAFTPADHAYAASKVSTASASTVKSPEKFVNKKSGKTVGSAKKSGKALASIMVKTKGVKVTYWAQKGSSWKKAANGKATAGSKKTAISGLKMKISGGDAAKYSIAYRVYVPGYGWMGWAKDGEKTGCSKSTKMVVSAYQVKLVKKGAAPAATSPAYISFGDLAINKAIRDVATKNGNDLAACCKALAFQGGLIGYGATGLGTITSPSQYTAKRMLAEAKAAFVTKKGNCYTHATAAVLVAKYLGYDAKFVPGTFQNKSGAWTDFAWMTINQDGVDVVYDAYNWGKAEGPFGPDNENFSRYKAA